MTQPSRSLVLAKLHESFPDEKQAADALALLDGYGCEPHERERERVQLALLRLSGGRIDTLRHDLETARCDYRDVLAPAEFPGQMLSGASAFNSLPEELRRIEAEDRSQYLAWLQGDPAAKGGESRRAPMDPGP